MDRTMERKVLLIGLGESATKRAKPVMVPKLRRKIHLSLRHRRHRNNLKRVSL